MDSVHRAASVLSESATEVYDTIVFNDPSKLYNQRAPDPIVSFIIGGVLCILTALYWYRYRWTLVRKSVQDKRESNSLTIRTFISTLADNDEPLFTILRVSSQSMLFLGGFQLDYKLTFSIMLVYYAIISFSDSLRVLLSLKEAQCLQDLVVVSKRDKKFLLESLKLKAEGRASIELSSGNVYENVSQNAFVVGMVFLTQVVLIAFVVRDIFNTESQTVLDGTGGVPILSTLGSWLIYLLGIFMQCVYLLGPKTNFGTSEQNPHFWLQLLLASKSTGVKCKWLDEMTGEERERQLWPSDFRLWLRFIMSFLINGVGFHILIHALPVQVAGQSSLTGVVFRSVGLVYIVDLDDAPSTNLKLVESRPEDLVQGDADAEGKKDSQFGSEPSATYADELAVTHDESEMEQNVPDKTPEELIERARLQAEVLQTQLQKDLDALAAKAAAEVDKQQSTA